MLIATKEGTNTLVEIEDVLGGLAQFNDDEITKAITTLFDQDLILSDLDASGICVLLMNKRNVISGQQTTWFDMETL